MDHQRKIMGARRKLKQYQQSKTNHQHQNVPVQQNNECKTGPAEVSHEKVESPARTDTNSTSSPGNPLSRKHSIIADDPTFINIADPTSSAPNSDCRLPVETTDTNNFTDTGLEFNLKENLSNLQMPMESNAETHRVDNAETIETQSQSVHGRPFPSPPVSPSPPQYAKFSETRSENGISDSPSLQKEHLLQMASAVTDALTDNSECMITKPLEADLEYVNQFLSSCLEEQKQLVNQLHVQVSHYSSRASELEAILATKDAEFEAKLLREVNPLKEQLLVHAQTTGILVAEKAELTAAIEQCQATANRKSEEVEELNGRLKTSQNRITELEKELSHVRNIVDDTRKMYQQLHLDYAELDKRYNDLRKSKNDDELEASELRQELSMKNTENLTLQRELEEKNTLLSLNDLKIQQLTSTPQEMQALEGQHHALVVLEQQLSQSRETLKTINREKEEAAKQYESYVRQLDSRYENIVKELEVARKKIDVLDDRESSYIQRLSDLEISLQREKQTVEKLLPLQAHAERIEHLTKSLDALNLEHSNLQATLNERETEIEMLKRELEEMRETNEDSVDKSRLVSALESEQLGASRAVSQNQQLKVQLKEMHDAFVTLSNSKLDLTEQLQGERAIGKKLNAHLHKVETEMGELKEQLKAKEDALKEMESEKLQTAQIADQMHHYQAQSNQARTLQQELQNSLGCMEILRRENQQLATELNELKYGGLNDTNLSNGDDNSQEETDGDGVRKTSTYSLIRASNGNTLISDPLKKLEVRFKETMERVAELTDEKQRLEHLVLQLQGETETIGEYITLYQKQRAILQKKAREREESFRQVIEQRNHQQEQLHQLKVLVADLLKKKSTNSVAPDSNSPSIIEFENEIEQETHEHNGNVEQNTEQHTSEESFIDVKDKTASKILDLLTEIKDCDNTCILEPNFHPCPWCSGKLITV